MGQLCSLLTSSSGNVGHSVVSDSGKQELHRDVYKRQVLELRVAQSDMGKVIGKQGRIAKAIRSVVKEMCIRDRYLRNCMKWPNR